MNPNILTMTIVSKASVTIFVMKVHVFEILILRISSELSPYKRAPCPPLNLHLCYDMKNGLSVQRLNHGINAFVSVLRAHRPLPMHDAETDTALNEGLQRSKKWVNKFLTTPTHCPR